MNRDSFPKETWRAGNLLYPLPVVMVSCARPGEKPNIITVAWAGTVCTNPPMVSISVRPERYSHDIIEETGEFVINLVTQDLVQACDWCGVRSGQEHDKFAVCALTPLPSEKMQAAPLIAQSPVNIECRVTQKLALGSHDLFLAEVVCVHVDPAGMDEKGRYDLGRMGLVTYSHGEYYALGEKLGSFGYSVKKDRAKADRKKAERSGDGKTTVRKKAERSRSGTGKQRKRRKGSALMGLALAVILAVGSLLIPVTDQVSADEIVPDAGTAEEANPSAAAAEDSALPVEEAPASQEDLSGLFVETGEDVVVRKGETLEEAREEDDPLYGSGDGGRWVNIGHLYEINGVLVRNSDFPSEHYECWTYANNVYAKIWGHNFLNLFQDSENLLRNLPDEELTLTPEHLKAYVSAAPAGAVLRVCDAQYLHADDGWGHSQIIISHDANGFTVFEGGLAAWPHRREAYYTWTGFCYSGWPGKYHYIKYVKWPGAAAYSRGASGGNAQDLGESRMEQLQPALRDTFQDLIQIVSDLVRGEAKEEDLERVKDAMDEVMDEAAEEAAEEATEEATEETTGDTASSETS